MIIVSDSLLYSPEKCAVIALYKKVVVGVALISSPVETYINYLVVRTGWDNSQIATYVSLSFTSYTLALTKPQRLSGRCSIISLH